MEGSERFSGDTEEPSNEYLPRNEVVMERNEEDLNSSIKTTKENTIQNTEENTKEITEQNAKDSNTEENETETLQKISITDNFLKEEEDILNIDDQVIDSLSEGLLHKIQPEIDSFSNSFQELTRNQRVLMETVQQENVKLLENKDINDLAAMVSNILFKS
ncbi:uncharacterized protein LOC117119937 [Anneissia japonica]|uniref:uncharacterized protein LOC117119937 n=1 Tax=Anneissia japonica TaxID=1529436 RepID=UPI001425695A|nr:uncharacterized protein LOC117119937 [Anneissia japonica]